MSAQSLQAQLQAATAEYQKVQTDLSKIVEASQRLGAQLQENELVKKEFALLTPNNIVYKQIGPVLVKQDPLDAKSNVETRLTFIKGEIKRLETQLKDVSSKSEQKKNEIVKIQTALQGEASKGPNVPVIPPESSVAASADARSF